jgi:hypothetical protein
MMLLHRFFSFPKRETFSLKSSMTLRLLWPASPSVAWYFLETNSNFLGQPVTPCASSPLRPFIFSDYSFLVHNRVNRNDQRLLARAMISDFSVEWQFSQREQLYFL